VSVILLLRAKEYSWAFNFVLSVAKINFWLTSDSHKKRQFGKN